jgi:SNF2 family DNA or RNA helicase
MTGITPPHPMHPFRIIGLKGVLRKFQIKGIRFIENRQGRCLLADEMGLGKTIQALGWLQLNIETALPAVIVVPAALKSNWKFEIEKWMTDQHPIMLFGKKSQKITHEGIIIINYDILDSWIPQIKKIKPKTLILDECHYTTNKKTKRSRAVKKLARVVKHIIGISGTPIKNRPWEFHNIISMIDPLLFPNPLEYAERYCNAHYTRFGFDRRGASNTLELNTILAQTIMLRRKKVDVLKELPPKNRMVILLDIDNKIEYDKAEKDIINWININKGIEAGRRAEKAEALVKLSALSQLAIKGKIKSCIEWIENFLQTEQKLIIFVTHIQTINILFNHFKSAAVKMDGGTSLLQRDEAIKKFQTDSKTKLFIGMIDKEGKPAGVGITLTAASTVAFIELQDSPYVHDQAEDRAHRIGQTADVLNIYFLLAANTIDAKKPKLLDKKRSILEEVMDGKETHIENLNDLLLKELMLNGKINRTKNEKNNKDKNEAWKSKND